jgi:hypothetical protein
MPEALARLHESTSGLLREIDRIGAAALRDAARKKRRTSSATPQAQPTGVATVAGIRFAHVVVAPAVPISHIQASLPPITARWPSRQRRRRKRTRDAHHAPDSGLPCRRCPSRSQSDAPSNSARDHNSSPKSTIRLNRQV